MDGRHARGGDPGYRAVRARLHALVFGCSALIIALSAVLIALRPTDSTAESAVGDNAGAGTSAPAASSRAGPAARADSGAPGPGVASVSGSAASRPAAPPGLLFGIGAEAGSARATRLAREAPVRLLTSWYKGPSDLIRLAGWRTGMIPQAYRAGYALHVIMYSGDSTSSVTTKYGTACGRPYPLSIGFLSDMQQLAKIFAGAVQGPPLYVTLFTGFQTYPCIAGAWNPNTATMNYYRALKDQYTAAEAIFHANAPNARVSLGWGGGQARTDDPADGGGRSLFAHFADVMKASDFESFQAAADDANAADVEDTVRILGAYGPVMVACYEPGNGSQATYDTDMRALFGPGGSLPRLVGAGLFAFSFMDDTQMNVSADTYQLVKNAVSRYGRPW